jgi:hypothetical protein
VKVALLSICEALAKLPGRHGAEDVKMARSKDTQGHRIVGERAAGDALCTKTSVAFSTAGTY